MCFFFKVGEEKGVNLKCQVNELDGNRLVVQTKEEAKGELRVRTDENYQVLILS